MSEQVNDGGPAFSNPCEVSQTHYGNPEAYMGMSLREYFAAKAMQGIITALHEGIRPVDLPTMAADAYGIADAMLAARTKL